MTKITFENLIEDPSFIRWVNRDENSSHWEKIEADNIEAAQIFREAKEFVATLNTDNVEIDPSKSERIQKRIINSQRQPIKLSHWLTTAAVVSLIITLWTTKRQHPNTNTLEDTIPIAVQQTQIITSDGNSKEWNHQSSNIKQDQQGNIVVNAQDTLKQTATQKNTPELHKLIVPFGKRSEIELADGTYIYVNSGSILRFPSKFDGKQREVHLIGEAYFKVKSDAEHPFIVHTNSLDYRVTGTQFNITAYTSNQYDQAVLVEGKITAIKHGFLNKEIELSPGQQVRYTKQNRKLTCALVNTQHSTSWIHGYLLFSQETIPNIIEKLERYYNVTIKTADELENISFSGKLDLNREVEDVLLTLSFAASLRTDKKEDHYYMKLR